jgi:hypothetical protein
MGEDLGELTIKVRESEFTDEAAIFAALFEELLKGYEV